MKKYNIIYISGSAQRKCEMKRRSILSEDNPTEAPPSCDVHGYYSPLQCDHLTKKCWCTDREGKEIEGTRTDGIANCGNTYKATHGYACVLKMKAVYMFSLIIFSLIDVHVCDLYL